MDIAFKLAELTDLPTLLEFTQGYYAFDGIPYVEEESVKALTQLMHSDQFGRIWLIVLEGVAIGYVVLTFGYSLEVGGRDAFIDELFLTEAHRGKGIGKRILEFVQAQARALEIKALHLVVEQDNERAQRLYEAAGFQARRRFFFMTYPVASPL